MIKLVVSPATTHLPALATWQAAREKAHAQFLAKRDIKPLWAALSAAMDAYIASVVGKDAAFAVMAVGGYGRAQLFPYSDIDVLLVVETDDVRAEVERVLYALWDVKLTVGHAVRTVQEVIDAAKADHTVMASVLDVRFVAGNKTLGAKCARRIARELVDADPLAFVEQKLAERDVRHSRALDSRLVLEPNVKEGKGGLRDLHTIWWLARYCYNIKAIDDLTKGTIFTRADARHYAQAMDYIATVRASLHLLSGRAEERLTFDAQLALAQQYHYRKSGEESAKRFMKHYFYHATRVGELTRSFCTLLEEEKKRPPSARLARWLAAPVRYGAFVREGERLSIGHAKLFRDDPLAMLRLFATAQAEHFDVHPHALKALRDALPQFGKPQRNSAEAAELFCSILLSSQAPHITLRRMSEAGLMARIIPEFAGIEGQMQYDRYHTYTVDEHTLKAIENLWLIERGDVREELPIATEIASQIQSRRALYVAMLTHDIGKGSGKQAERGEVLSAEIAKRLRLNEAEVETVAWLVRWHLLMSEVAFKRDLDDPKTIDDFVAVVQSPERLRLLLLITVADIRAVGPSIWNGWKGALLRDLYSRAMARMGGSETASMEMGQAKLRLSQQLVLNHSGWTQETITQFVEGVAPPVFWARPRAEQEALAVLYRRFRATGDMSVAVTQDSFRAITELTACVPSHPAVLVRAAGVAALMGANIVSAKLMVSREDATWVRLGVQNVLAEAFDADKAMREFPKLYGKVAQGTLDVAPELARVRPKTGRKTTFAEPARVLIDNALSATHSVIEVNGADRMGFLHDVAATLLEAGLVIATAHVATYGTRAVDVFYVKDSYGHKLLHQAKRSQVEQALLKILQR